MVLRSRKKIGSYHHRRWQFGLAKGVIEAMLAIQQHSCAICGVAFELEIKSKTFHVDHDHNTGRVRALLCHNCNVGLGHFGDSPELMIEAIAYLRHHAEETVD